MARRRMIDPHFWESGDVKRLNHFERLFLIGMFSLADDVGRGTGGATYLKSIIFPHDEISSTKIKKAIASIKETISVLFYEVDDQEYYQFTNWKKWQRVDKPQESFLPEPPTHSKNDSKNDSGNNLESIRSDSVLKERKGKEEKGRPPYTPQEGEYCEPLQGGTALEELSAGSGEAEEHQEPSRNKRKPETYVTENGKEYTLEELFERIYKLYPNKKDSRKKTAFRYFVDHVKGRNKRKKLTPEQMAVAMQKYLYVKNGEFLHAPQTFFNEIVEAYVPAGGEPYG